MRQSATWRRSELPTCIKGETTLQTTFAKKRGRHTHARFSRCQDSRCVCFPGQASGTMGGRGARVAQAQGAERPQGCCATPTGTAAASGTQAQAAKGDCNTDVGPGGLFWLSLVVPTRLSQDSHLHPRTFRGHSLQMGRVFDSGGRTMDNAIIFCAKCGAVYWERADALCRRCSDFPGGRASKLRN